MIKVIIADDHTIVRKGLIQIIEKNRDIKVVAEASDGKETVRKVLEHNSDIVILDLNMPGRSGVEILRDLISINNKIKVIILSVHNERPIILSVLKTGAKGYLSKESAPEELIDAIQRVYSGEKYISPNLAEKLVFDLSEQELSKPHERLSEREFQTLLLIGQGKSVGVIALEMNLSVKTISTYRTRILQKLGLTNNSEIMHYVIESKLE